MSYVALYRAYRPQTFDDVAGQQTIVQTLQNAIKTNKVGHAYLFSGPRGTGKTSLAKIFAKAVNCKTPVNGNPCNTCETCIGITSGAISDVIEIDGASNNGVDEIRELRDKVKYMPSVGKYKVYIIDEVHMLTAAAFNALLKTLEEPPSHVIFILATTEVHKIPLTILSRCQRFDFKNIDHKNIVKRLKEVIENEKIKIEDEAIDEIAISAEGGLRDALSLLDQAISYSQEKITAMDVSEISGSVSKKDLIDLLEVIADRKTADVITKINIFLENGKEEDRIVNDLILTLRDVLLDKVLPNKSDNLKIISDKLSIDKIYYYLEVLTKTQNDMRWTHQKRVYLELAAIQLIEHKTIAQLDLQTSLFELRSDFEKLKANGIKTSKKLEKGKKLVEVSEIEATLYEAEVPKKERLEKLMSSFNNVSDNLQMTAHLLKESELVAASINKIILTHKDINIARELMQPSSYLSVLELFNMNGHEIDSYVVILDSDWLVVRQRYVELLKAGQKRPKIGDYDFKIYEIIKTSDKIQVPESIRLAQEYFGEENVEIKE